MAGEAPNKSSRFGQDFDILFRELPPFHVVLVCLFMSNSAYSYFYRIITVLYFFINFLRKIFYCKMIKSEYGSVLGPKGGAAVKVFSRNAWENVCQLLVHPT